MKSFRYFEFIDNCIATVSVVAMLLIVSITIVDVALRYFFHSPFTWSYEFITYYLMASAIMLSMSAAQRHHEHIQLDLLRARLGIRHRSMLDIGTAILGFGICAVLGWLATYRVFGAVAFDERLTGSAGLLAWPSYLMGPVGFGLCAITFLFQAIKSALFLAGRLDQDELQASGHEIEAID